MAKSLSPGSPGKGRLTSPLMVRLGGDSKNVLIRAAALRRLSLSDYVRAITVAQARKEILADDEQTLVLSPESIGLPTLMIFEA